MARAIAIQASAERLDRTAKFAGEVFGLMEEDDAPRRARPRMSASRIAATAVAVLACGYVFLF